MPDILRSRAVIIGLALTVVALGLVGFIPLFGGPGYESALAAGLIVPVVVAVVVAIEIAASRLEPFDAFCRGVAVGALLGFGAYVTTLAHGLRVGFCDLLGGSAHFALGPVAGALLAGGWGALAGEIARRVSWPHLRTIVAALLAVSLPMVSILLGVSRFYSSPMVFAYDPFVGYFSGTLYDTVVDFSGLVTYRAGSACSLFAAFVAALHLGRDEHGRLAYQEIGRPGMLTLGGLALAGSVACIIEGDRLGHWQTPATIKARLGAVVSGDRCDVIYPRSLRLPDVQRFARDCDAHVVAGERYFEAEGSPKITAYLFADVAQKAALMGAATTYVAKPWRHEIYVQAAGYPHPALGHEIMHVLAGSFARGPLRVAGSLGGLLPNPGLIEGVAVAAAPPEGDLSPREWAKAMKDLGILPRLARLFALGFLGENASTAYTVSGAFVAYVHDRFGAAAVKSWYGGAALPEVTHVSWADLEAGFHADLDTVVLPAAARAQAKARFDRPAIFGRRCPHAVDACKERGDGLRVAGDYAGAAAEYAAALAIDPHDIASRLSVGLALVRAGEPEAGEAAIARAAADASLPGPVRDRALEQLGDLALAAGNGALAVECYRKVAERSVDEDELRTLEVKIASEGDERARAAVVALLIGSNGRPPDKALAAELLASWSAAVPEDGLPLYLLGRQLMNAGDLEHASNRLDRALSAKIALPRVAAEAERLRMVVACGFNDAATARRFYDRYAARALVSEARRAAARALLGRCAVQKAPRR
jgi:tetratricopeptide (TPR) repeat protein